MARRRQPPFEFEIEFEANDSPPVLGAAVMLRARLRHSHDCEIKLAPGIEGAFNVGLCVYGGGSGELVFEDRMVPQNGTLLPGVWSDLSVRVPVAAFGPHREARVTADMVKEGEFWFSPAGEPAASTIVRLRGAVARADGVGVSTRFRTAPRPEKKAGRKAGGPVPTQTSIIFDVSDLVHYFIEGKARLPTGIQRVQIEIICSVLDDPPPGYDIVVGCFAKRTDGWIELPPLFFIALCRLAVVGGDPEAPDWREMLDELKELLKCSAPLGFRPGAFLINLGTSWWLKNYFLRIRAAKARYGIRYVPLIYDMIPVLAPEHCIPALTRDFISWLLGAFQHADHLLAISQATANDVVKVAGVLGHAIEAPAVVPLDTDFRGGAARAATARTDEQGVLANHRLKPGGYVLFVSTIESRKNHLLAFAAWLRLLKTYGAGRVPKLVCVGNRGWLNDAIYAKLSASSLLRENVLMLSRIADPDLDALYRNCLFTFYPSSHEGWGLPITESLCLGKVPVVADTSSLPEAGGPFAVYFDPGSENDLIRALETMMFDPDERLRREARIAAEFRPRTWRDVAEQILSLTGTWRGCPVWRAAHGIAVDGAWAFPAEPGRLHPLTENRATELRPGMTNAEMFRQGDGWWWPEAWGCWTKPSGGRMCFLVPMDGDGLLLVVGLRGAQGQACNVTVSLAGDVSRTASLQPGEDRWLPVRIGAEEVARLPTIADSVLIDVTVTTEGQSDFAALTNGEDGRVAGAGVRGFAIAAEGDTKARLRILEAVAFGEFDGLAAVRP